MMAWASCNFLIILHPSRLFSSWILPGHVARKPPFMDPHQVIQQYGGPEAKGQRTLAGPADDFTGHARSFRRVPDRIRVFQRRGEEKKSNTEPPHVDRAFTRSLGRRAFT